MSDGPAVGVVGPAADPVVAALRAAGGVPETGPATAVVDDSEYVVAVGEPALLAVARARPAVPVLPVAAGRGVRLVPREQADGAVDALLADDYACDEHPLLEVSVADRTTATALCDVLAVSVEPAQISEYAVSAGGERVGRFRADGVVVGTPAGSSGYARAAGGPVLAPGSGVVSVVPVAPFATGADHWVVPPADLRVDVERDETAVQLVVDDRAVGPVDPADPVRLSPADAVTVAVVPASQSPYGTDGQ